MIEKKTDRLKEMGFTVTELLVVLAIFAAAILIALPDYLSTILPEHKMKSAARDVMTDMRWARMRSVSRNREYRIVFFPNQNSYVIQAGNHPSGSTSWQTDGSVRRFSAPGNAHFHEDVTIDEVLISPGNTIVYKPTGEVTRTRVVMSHPKAGTWRVRGSIAGRVSLEKG